MMTNMSLCKIKSNIIKKMDYWKEIKGVSISYRTVIGNMLTVSKEKNQLLYIETKSENERQK